MFAYLSSQFYSPRYLEFQEQTNIRISQLDREFIFVRDSIVPQVVRFSTYHATHEFINLLLEDETLRNSLNNSHRNIQNSIFELAINGSYQGINRPAMENRTIPHLLDFYVDFFNTSMVSDLEYTIINGRVFEQTPLQLSIQTEINLSLQARELDFNLFDQTLVKTSFSIEGIRDPKIGLHVNNATAEPIRRERTASSYTGEDDWSWNLFNETFEEGLVTIFTYPEFRYTVGTSFLRSITNSTTRGLISDMLAFLSFQYERDATPYDTRNFNTTHTLYGPTLFLASFDNISSRVDETSYNFNLNLTGVDCTVPGVSNNSCNLNNQLREIENLELQGENATISLWVNYQNSGVIFNSSSLRLEVDNVTETLQVFGTKTQTPTSFEINNIRLRPNVWNNIIVHANSQNEIDVFINAELRYAQVISGGFEPITNIEIGNALFDEIKFINRSVSQRELSRIVSQRRATFLEYQESLYDYGLVLTGAERVDLNLSHVLNRTFDEFTVEFWIQIEELHGDLTILELSNSSLNRDFSISLNQSNVFIDASNGGIPQQEVSSPVRLDDNRYKHVLVQIDSNNRITIHVNTQLLLNESFTVPIGNYSQSILFPNSHTHQVRGILDEFVMYSTSFDEFEIHEHYYNFQSRVGGCCNYFKMFNPMTHGVTIPDTPFPNPISTVFVNIWGQNNISLEKIGQRNSSFPSSANWHNFSIDACQIFVYNTQSYVGLLDAHAGETGRTCRELIEAGIY